jgi:hypothetical protein
VSGKAYNTNTARKAGKEKGKMFEATKHALQYGQDYANYIQASLERDVQAGRKTLEEAQTCSLGSLLVGNDGD